MLKVVRKISMGILLVLRVSCFIRSTLVDLLDALKILIFMTV